MALASVGAHRGDEEVGVDAVGDERLRAVHDVVAVLADGGRRDPGQIGTGARLGHRDRRDQLPAREARQPTLLLLLGRVAGEVRQADVAVDRHPQVDGADAHALRLFAQYHVEAEVVDARAAVLLGHRHSEEAVLTRLGEHLPGHEAFSLPLLVVRSDLPLQKRAPTRAEIVVLVVEDSATHRTAGYGRKPNRHNLSCNAGAALSLRLSLDRRLRHAGRLSFRRAR
jgi:hypothetical protein